LAAGEDATNSGPDFAAENFISPSLFFSNSTSLRTSIVASITPLLKPAVCAVSYLPQPAVIRVDDNASLTDSGPLALSSPELG
jgi:hypothetical protein